ncbi:ArdC-like ssDNA-binding domain-containing protein [Leptospira bouyouniensis]|uniref:ArdC-like ssDNA-binding domain-containing protein n=1 Tax=Leptospira bouyouniensis TaxID=2484911 RepID=UPI001FC9D61B|nr:ArdC family protein [Leptospira bouyouniensis]
MVYLSGNDSIWQFFVENCDTLGVWITSIVMKENDAKTILKKITYDVMEALKSGSLGQWVKPWQSFGFPTNVKTKQQYGLLNTFWLTDSLMRYGYTYPA